ncbi:glycosyltransferase family 2 protein [bacterium]|nr:glycosyltransferase family 2 protein [candidate division CSSED10-310 bacterium]
MKIYAVIPAYDERPSISLTINALLHEGGVAMQPIVVDDGSRDGTSQILDELAADGTILLIRHTRNRGVGAAFLSGFQLALQKATDQDIVMVLEADGTSDPSLLPEMIEMIETDRADVVIASRFIPGGCMCNFPFLRVILSRACNLLLRKAAKVPGVRDYTNFYRAYRPATLRRALAGLTRHPEDFSFNAYLLVKAASFARIRELPFRYDYSRKKSSSKLKLGSNFLSYLTLLRLLIFGGR